MNKPGEQNPGVALVDAYRRLSDLGLMNQATGNVSCRVEGGMLISCSGATASNLDPGRVVKVRNDGGWEGELKPSSEWRMHLQVYHRHEQANAVVHTHSDYCVAMACNQLPLPGFHYMVATFGGRDVPCVPYSTFGSESLAKDAAEALTDRFACLLGSHGMICRGTDLESAVKHAERLEILCRHYCLARQIGEPKILSDEEWERFFDQAKKLSYTDFITPAS
jgi:L-fuculose-phosphate aldolase